MKRGAFVLYLTLSFAGTAVSTPASAAAILDKATTSVSGEVKFAAVARDRTPYGPFWLMKGEDICSVPKGQEVTIVGQKVYPGFGGNHVWYEVAPDSLGNPVCAGSGQQSLWIYGGQEGGATNIQVHKAGE